MRDKNKKKHESRIHYSTDGRGRWWKRVTSPQCSNGVFFGHECQGVAGHKGVHWCFNEHGSFIYEDNDDDQTQGGCSGSTPPDHKHYRTPLEMQKEYYMQHSVSTEITDPEEIAKLEEWRDKPTKKRYEYFGEASFDGPASPEDVKSLKEMGRLEPLPKYGKPKTDQSTDHHNES